MCYAFAVKHYLRGEDGLDWEDYAGLLSLSVAHLARPGGARRTPLWTSYAAIERTSPEESATASGDEGDAERASVLQSRQGNMNVGAEAQRDGVDATKRIRAKRSKDKMKQPGVKSSSTPLLSGLHQTIDFRSDPGSLTTPLPLV